MRHAFWNGVIAGTAELQSVIGNLPKQSELLDFVEGQFRECQNQLNASMIERIPDGFVFWDYLKDHADCDPSDCVCAKAFRILKDEKTFPRNPKCLKDIQDWINFKNTAGGLDESSLAPIVASFGVFLRYIEEVTGE